MKTRARKGRETLRWEKKTIYAFNWDYFLIVSHQNHRETRAASCFWETSGCNYPQGEISSVETHPGIEEWGFKLILIVILTRIRIKPWTSLKINPT